MYLGELILDGIVKVFDLAERLDRKIDPKSNQTVNFGYASVHLTTHLNTGRIEAKVVERMSPDSSVHNYHLLEYRLRNGQIDDKTLRGRTLLQTGTRVDYDDPTTLSPDQVRNIAYTYHLPGTGTPELPTPPV